MSCIDFTSLGWPHPVGMQGRRQRGGRGAVAPPGILDLQEKLICMPMQWHRKIFCKGGLIVVWPRPPQLRILAKTERGWNSRLGSHRSIIISVVDLSLCTFDFET